MNNQTTRIWTTLRYLAVIPLIALGILSILATGGGGGSSGGVTTPPPAGSSNWDELIWDQDQWA